MATVTPSDTFNTAISTFKSAVAQLSPEDQTRINYAFDDLEPVLKDELDRVAGEYASKLPVVGSLAAGIVKSAINKALDDALSELTAAKAAASAA